MTRILKPRLVSAGAKTKEMGFSGLFLSMALRYEVLDAKGEGDSMGWHGTEVLGIIRASLEV